MMTELRAERHVLKPSHPYYDQITGFCRRSKDLYNHANYLIRQAFIKNGKWMRYEELDKALKQDQDHPDYKEMPTAQSAQQTLKMLDTAWTSFFTEIKDWKQHPEKYKSRPKLPKYLKKNSSYCLILTNQNCKVKDGRIKFPKAFGEFSLKPEFLSDSRFISFQQVRFIPHGDFMAMELVYQIRIEPEKEDNRRYIAIDLGVNNLAAVVNNWGGKPFILNGRPLKSMNQFANKERARYQQVLKQVNGRHTSRRLGRLMAKRNCKVNDYLHKASRYIVNYCIANDVSRVIIGKNKSWKQECGLGKRANQNFVQIPFERFIQMLTYKAREFGIAVILTEESYTSGTSFLDNEDPVKRYYNKRRRIYRGLFRSDDGTLINADINGAFQIMKKVVPIKWDRGCVLHPFIVTAA